MPNIQVECDEKGCKTRVGTEPVKNRNVAKYVNTKGQSPPEKTSYGIEKFKIEHNKI